MKASVADYRFRVLCMRIVPTTGSPIYLTDYPTNLVMNSHTYLSTNGYQFSGYNAEAGFSPSSIDLEGIAGAAGISRAQIGSGLFDGARCYAFATTWSNPVEDQEPIVAGIFGQASLMDNRYTINGMSLVDALNQSVGDIYTPSCPKVFCGQEFGGCKANLAANTVTGTLTAVASGSIFTDSSRLEAADTFGAGTIQFTSGPNAGFKPQEIKSFSGGVIEVFEPFYYLPAVGNTYSMVRGCRKTIAACQARVGGSNIVNFGGFPWIPTGSTYATFGTG